MVGSTYTGQTGFAPKEANVEGGNYLKLFDSVTQYTSESGLGVALKGMSTLLDKGLDAANALYLADKRDEVEKRIEPIVEENTKNLEDAREYIKAKTRPIASQSYSTDLLPGPEGGSPAGTPVQAADAPPDLVPDNARIGVQQNIRESSDYLDTIKAGVAQGKISDVYFKGAIANEAKDIRNNTLVGFRPEVDAMISAKMHTVQANPYYEALLHDINTSLTAGHAEKNASLAFIRSHAGIPGSEQVFDDRSNDRITDSEVMRRMTPSIQLDYQVKQAKQQLEYQGEYLKVNTAVAERNANSIVSANALIFHSADTTAVGVSSKELEDLSAQALSGTKTLTSEQAQYYAGKAKAIGQAYYYKTLNDLREVHTDSKTGQKYSYESLTSPDFVKNAAKAGADYWDKLSESFYKGDLSAATFNTRMLEAAKENTLLKNAYEHPDAMAALTVVEYLKKNGVPEQTLHETLAANGTIPKLSAMVAKSKFEMSLPDEVKGSLPNGQTVRSTFKENLANIKAVYDANGMQYDVGAHSLTDFTKIIDGRVGMSLVNTNDPKMIDTIAHHVFGPGNENAFKYFNTNTYDAKGNIIPGYQALFNRFSQPDVVKQIMKGSAQTKAEYDNFMKITAREDILRNDLPKLKEFFNTPNLPYQIGWDTDKKNLVISDSDAVAEALARRTGSMTDAMRVRRRTDLNQTVNNINMTLDGLRSIAETSGKKDLDVDSYVLAPIMQSLGDISDVKGMPSALALQIKGAYLKQKFENEASQGPGNKELYTSGPKKVGK
jgi:hypothetical protein